MTAVQFEAIMKELQGIRSDIKAAQDIKIGKDFMRSMMQLHEPTQSSPPPPPPPDYEQKGIK
jgi:hypothetical protein